MTTKTTTLISQHAKQFYQLLDDYDYEGKLEIHWANLEQEIGYQVTLENVMSYFKQEAINTEDQNFHQEYNDIEPQSYELMIHVMNDAQRTAYALHEAPEALYEDGEASPIRVMIKITKMERRLHNLENLIGQSIDIDDALAWEKPQPLSLEQLDSFFGVMEQLRILNNKHGEDCTDTSFLAHKQNILQQWLVLEEGVGRQVHDEEIIHFRKIKIANPNEMNAYKIK